VEVRNLFCDIPSELKEERVESLVAGRGVRIEKIVSRGHASPEGFWYDQEQHEWVVLLAGSAAIAFEDREDVVSLLPGDCLEIPAHARHRVEWTDADRETIWLAVFYTRRT
jgi:cupin 2 domain-containing protein